jgi:uncharacterized protein
MNQRKLSTLAVCLSGAAITAFLFRFNQQPQPYERYLVGNMAALFWVPMLIVLLLLKDRAEDFGFAPPAGKGVWLWTLVLAIAVLLLETVISKWPSYQGYYPMYREFGLGHPAKAAPRLLLYFELTYGMYLFCWEFFFRGYLLFGLGRVAGWWAVLLQAVPFGILHYGKPEFVFSFAGGIILGALAYRSRSFMPAFVLHWVASAGLDMMVWASLG